MTTPAPNPDQPLLGLATTKQLLEEIKARGEVEIEYSNQGIAMKFYANDLLELLSDDVLKYRTVDEK